MNAKRMVLIKTTPMRRSQPAVCPEQEFRELGERFLRCTDPEEQSRLKTELVRSLIRRLDARKKPRLVEV
jgi:hypothetical protein